MTIRTIALHHIAGTFGHFDRIEFPGADLANYTASGLLTSGTRCRELTAIVGEPDSCAAPWVDVFYAPGDLVVGVHYLKVILEGTGYRGVFPIEARLAVIVSE